MEALLSHFKIALEGITMNTGTVDDPVLVRMIREVSVDEGQMDNKVTVQLPAAYFDITNMAYSAAGENIGMADTEVTVRLAVRKNDATRHSLINAISKALVGTSGTSFGGILKESQLKVSYDDIFEYRITFGCMLFDHAAVPDYDTLTDDERPAAELTFKVKKPGS